MRLSFSGLQGEQRDDLAGMKQGPQIEGWSGLAEVTGHGLGATPGV